MIGRRHPGHCSGSGDESGLGPQAPLGAELDRVGRRRLHGELAWTVEHHDQPSPDVDLDEASGIALAAAPRRQLEDPEGFNNPNHAAQRYS